MTSVFAAVNVGNSRQTALNSLFGFVPTLKGREQRRRSAAQGLRDVRRRQRQAYGGLSGWLVAVLNSLDLPRIPVDERSLSTGGLIALAAIAVGTLLAAVAGGQAGSHYHRKVDRVGL
jgi:hypothetical protein